MRTGSPTTARPAPRWNASSPTSSVAVGAPDAAASTASMRTGPCSPGPSTSPGWPPSGSTTPPEAGRSPPPDLPGAELPANPPRHTVRPPAAARTGSIRPRPIAATAPLVGASAEAPDAYRPPPHPLSTAHLVTRVPALQIRRSGRHTPYAPTCASSRMPSTTINCRTPVSRGFGYERGGGCGEWHRSPARMRVSRTAPRSGLLCSTTVHPSCSNVSLASRGCARPMTTRYGAMLRPGSTASSSAPAVACEVPKSRRGRAMEDADATPRLTRQQRVVDREGLPRDAHRISTVRGVASLSEQYTGSPRFSGEITHRLAS
jgi:hypothetical protein